MHIAFPYRIDGRGLTADATHAEHIRHLIEQLLFTSPGERVNRPDFGTGLMQLVFGPNSDELATATQFLVQGSLQQWLGDFIQIEAVDVENEDSMLKITVQYRLRSNQEKQSAEFLREI